MAILTHAALKRLTPGTTVSDGGPRGGGTMEARRLAGGDVLFYFRYTSSTGGRERIPLGAWKDAGGVLTLADARQKADALSARYVAGERDLREILEAEEREAKRERAAARRAEEEAQAKQDASLRALLDAYVAQLVSQGKPSAAAVAASIKRHIYDPWPELSALPAEEIELDDLLQILSKLAEDDKLREANKVRSYLQSAYTAAIRARQSAQASPALRALKITRNPARELATIEGGSNARDRALSLAELRAYWKRIQKRPGAGGAALRFHLLTGGQRIEQLAELTTNDFDPDARTVTLRDTKGRRKQPRKHVVPLIPLAEEALVAMAPGRVGDYLVTLTLGASGVGYRYLRAELLKVVQEMTEAGELEKGEFTLGDLRRTVETRLSAAGVPTEVRAHLQSHGLGGVQARHYDRHDYLEEKRGALETLFRLMTDTPGKVVTMRRRK